MNKKGILFFLVVIVCSSCTSNNNSGNGIIQHPTKENLPNPALENEYLIDSDMVEISDSHQKELLNKLENMQRISSNEDGIANELFGIISDVEIDDKNRTYVLDERRQEVVAFNESGDYIATIAGEGKGPGELEHANSMDIYNDEWLLIEGNYRIEVYDISGEEIKFIETIQLDRSLRSICVIDNYLFLHPVNVSDEKKVEEENFVNTIHKYSLPDFKYLASFGESYRSQNMMVIDRLSVGTISCDESTNTVSYLFERFPIIHGYDANTGEMKWKTGFEELNTTHITETNKSGSTTIGYGNSGKDYLDRLLTGIDLDNEYMLFQIDRNMLTAGSFGTNRKVLTALVNTKNGQGYMVSNELPLLFGISDHIAVSVQEVFSSVKLYTFEN